jgi:hypothetical protein
MNICQGLTYTKEFKADALAYIASHPDIPIQTVA